jgi:hypothetical protein
MIKYAAPLAAIALLLTLTTARSYAEDKKETGKVTGTVVDKDGKPAVGAEVGIFHPMGKSKPAAQGQAEKPAKGEKPISVVPAVKTDDKGEFALNDVPVGDYTVVARLRGSGNGRENVSVKAGETAKVEIKLVYKAKTPVAGSEKPAADKDGGEK